MPTRLNTGAPSASDRSTSQHTLTMPSCCRRKYSQVFSEILGNERLLNDSRFHLTLIGQGQVDLPPELASKVTKLANLDYKVRSLPFKASRCSAECASVSLGRRAWSLHKSPTRGTPLSCHARG